MLIECTKPHTQRLKLPWMSDPVDFGDDGTAEVESDLGNRLADELDAIDVMESEDE